MPNGDHWEGRGEMSKLFLAPEFRLKLVKFDTKLLLISQATIKTSKRFASQDCISIAQEAVHGHGEEITNKSFPFQFFSIVEGKYLRHVLRFRLSHTSCRQAMKNFYLKFYLLLIFFFYVHILFEVLVWSPCHPTKNIRRTPSQFSCWEMTTEGTRHSKNRRGHVHSHLPAWQVLVEDILKSTEQVHFILDRFWCVVDRGI